MSRFIRTTPCHSSSVKYRYRLYTIPPLPRQQETVDGILKSFILLPLAACACGKRRHLLIHTEAASRRAPHARMPISGMGAPDFKSVASTMIILSPSDLSVYVRKSSWTRPPPATSRARPARGPPPNVKPRPAGPTRQSLRHRARQQRTPRRHVLLVSLGATPEINSAILWRRPLGDAASGYVARIHLWGSPRCRWCVRRVWRPSSGGRQSS